MRVGFLQFCPQRGQTSKNLERVRGLVSSKECDLLVLPELFNTGYLFSDANEARDLAEKKEAGRTS